MVGSNLVHVTVIISVVCAFDNTTTGGHLYAIVTISMHGDISTFEIFVMF